MKRNLILILLLCVSMLMIDEVSAQTIHVKAKKSYQLRQKDSVSVLNIDSLILDKKALLFVNDAKELTINAKYILIDDRAVIKGRDGKNNGTNLTIKGNFVKLGQLAVDLSGDLFEQGIRKYKNGDGGNLVIEYAKQGIKPQTENYKDDNFIAVLNSGAGKNVIPQVELFNVWTQIRNGAGYGRPGGPQGRVYDASVGKDGKFELKAVD